MVQTVFITGASSGIGRATARYFQKRGWQVAATMRHPADAGDLTALPRVRVYRLDVTKLPEIRAAVTATETDFGAVDVLVNNAGYGLLGSFEAATDAQVRQQIDTNLMGVVHVTRAVLPGMRGRGSGVIVNLSSNAGRMAFPFYSYYNATKYAVEGLSESLSHELSPFGIRVKVIEPGPIDTDFFGRSADHAETADIPEYRPYVERAFSFMHGGNRSFRSPPEAVSETIFRAATDGSGRLRYPAGRIAPLMMWIYGILPERLILSMIRRVTMRKE